VNEAIEDAVGQCRIADLFMPVGQRHLRSENGGTALIAIVTEFQEIAPLAVLQWRHGKVIQHQNVDTRKPQQQAAKAAIGVGNAEFPKEFGGPFVQDGVAIATGFLR